MKIIENIGFVNVNREKMQNIKNIAKDMKAIKLSNFTKRHN